MTEVFPDPVLVDFHLLDRQVVDLAGAKIGKVDDVELEIDDAGRPRITALLVGQRALGLRIGGPWGGRLAAVATRLRAEEDPRPLRIPYDHVAHAGSHLTVSLRREVLTTPPLESWLRRHLIGRIPGAGDARE
jgi:sporulation protein YlmC with PRC-barrel domain